MSDTSAPDTHFHHHPDFAGEGIDHGRASGGNPGKSSLTSRLPWRPPEVRAADAAARIDRSISGDGGIDGDATDRLSAARSGSGRGLDDTLRGSLEAALGVDLGGVSVHTDGPAASAAAAIGANAYAEGQDIYFGAGTYDPHGESGRRLIAHEVAHTVQQRGGGAGVQASTNVSAPGDAHEREADAFAAAFVSGSTARVTAGTAAGATAHRDAKDGDGGDGEFASLPVSERKRRFKKADTSERARLLGLVDTAARRRALYKVLPEIDRLLLLNAVVRRLRRDCLEGADMHEVGRLFYTPLGAVYALVVYRAVHAVADKRRLIAEIYGVAHELFPVLSPREQNQMVNEANGAALTMLAKAVPIANLVAAWPHLDEVARLSLHEQLPADRQDALGMAYQPEDDGQ